MEPAHLSKTIRRLLRTGRSLVHAFQNEKPTRVVRRVYRRLNRSVPRDPFDERYGVDTSGEISLCELDIDSHNERLGVHYQASPTEECNRVLASLPICYERFTFIDVGAGKGRVLLVASRYPFQRILGIEFAKDLCDTARTNVARFGSKAEVIHSDAESFQFPCVNLVVYLYNPFGQELLRPILRSLRHVKSSRDIYIVYLNPKHSLCVQEFATELYTLDNTTVYRMLPGHID